jgi:hypothetical protein
MDHGRGSPENGEHRATLPWELEEWGASGGAAGRGARRKSLADQSRVGGRNDGARNARHGGRPFERWGRSLLSMAEYAFDVPTQKVVQRDDHGANRRSRTTRDIDGMTLPSDGMSEMAVWFTGGPASCQLALGDLLKGSVQIDASGVDHINMKSALSVLCAILLAETTRGSQSSLTTSR